MNRLVVALMGQSGFVGRHIADAFERAKVPVLPLHRWDGDPTKLEKQLEKMKNANPESQIILVQAAWYSTNNSDYRSALENRSWIKTTKTIIEICKKWDIIFVGLGSCLEKLNLKDDIYARSKIEIQNFLAQELSIQNWIWFQIFYAYSKEYFKPEVVRRAAEAVNLGGILELKTPRSTHDFIEVRDVAEAIVHAVFHGFRGKIEIGVGRLLSVSYILKALFPDLKISENESTEVRISFQEPASIESLLNSGWKPKFSVN